MCLAHHELESITNIITIIIIIINVVIDVTITAPKMMLWHLHSGLRLFSHRQLQSYSHVQNQTGLARIQRTITCSKDALGIFRGTHHCQFPILVEGHISNEQTALYNAFYGIVIANQRSIQGFRPSLFSPSPYLDSAGFRHALHHIMASVCFLMHAHVRQQLLHKCVWGVSLLVGTTCLVPHCDPAEGTNSES